MSGQCPSILLRKTALPLKSPAGAFIATQTRSRRKVQSGEDLFPMKIFAAPQHTRSFCRRFTPTKSIAALLGRYFSFLGTCQGKVPLSCCARPFRCLKKPLWLSLLRYACKRKPYLENFISRPSVIPTFLSTPLHKQGQELRSEQTVTPLHEQHNLYLFLRLNNSETFVES